MPKVSVIVPAYNTCDSFFRKCIESLVGQTLKDIEIIVIDDGSTPEQGSDAPCVRLAKQYANADPRIKFLQQDHKGVSEARNLGIQKASGEYTVFLDSDDWFDTDALESLYNFASTQKSDITIFENYRDTENSCQAFKAFDNDIEIFENENLAELIKNAVQTNPLHCGIIIGVCCKFYRSDFLKSNNLIFRKGISLGEDRLFFLNALCKRPRLSYLSRPFYHYRESEGSLSQALRKDFGALVANSEKLIGELPLCDIYGIDRTRYLSWLYTDMSRIVYASLIQYYLNPQNKESFFESRKNFLEFINLDATQRALENYNQDAFTQRDRFKFFLCKHKLFSALYLFKIKLSLQRKILCRHK